MKTMKTSDAEWGKVLWDFVRDHIRCSGLSCELDTEDLMRLAQKHGRSKKVNYDPEVHGDIEADPGSEIWWWGDDQDDEAPEFGCQNIVTKG